MKPSQRFDEIKAEIDRLEFGEKPDLPLRYENLSTRILFKVLDEQYEAKQKAGIGCVIETNPDAL